MRVSPVCHWRQPAKRCMPVMGSWGLSFEMNALLLRVNGRAAPLMLFGALALVSGPAAAQSVPMPVAPAQAAKPRPAVPPARRDPEALAPGNPDYAADQSEAPEAAPLFARAVLQAARDASEKPLADC